MTNREHLRWLIARARENDRCLRAHFRLPKQQRARHRDATLARLRASNWIREDIRAAFKARNEARRD